MKLKIYDEVVLNDEYENRRIYVVAEIRKCGIVALFPKAGGFLVTANVKNLKKVK
jgi:hypothetical protein